MQYVVYYRVSTKKQGESGLGLESQRAYIEHFLPADAVVAEFTDIESGGVADRRQLRAAIDLCKKERATLAVAKIDRLSRVTEDALAVYSELEGRLFSCDIPNLDKFTLTLFMAIADRERELIKLRTKQALGAKKDRGEQLGTPANLTSEGRARAWAATRAKAAKQENNIRAIEMVRAYRGQGLTLRQIADKLNAAKFRASKGGKFTATQVARLINR
jgi:DNA invertase Pin-like site-specific DNA recombinase